MTCALRCLRRRWRLRHLVLAALLLALPATAHAHGRLKSSNPASGARLSQVPRQLRLDFTEDPALTFSSIRLLAPDGREVELGSVGYAADSRRSLVAPVSAVLSPGTYTVMWQIAGDDGHPVRGRYQFTLATGAVEAEARPPSGTIPRSETSATDSSMQGMHHDPASMPESEEFGVESPAYVAIRWLQFVALLLVIGAVTFHLFVLGTMQHDPTVTNPSVLALRTAADSRAAGVGHVAAMVLVATLVLRLVAQGYAMHGRQGAIDLSLMSPMLRSTTWGWGWLLQLAGIVLAGVGLHKARERAGALEGAGSHGRLEHRPGWWRLAAVGAVLLAFSPGLSSHAASSPTLRSLAMLADGLHVLGASSWLGTLAIVLFAGLSVVVTRPAVQGGAFVRDLINAFSRVALVSAGVAMITGVFSAWLHVGTVPNLWGTRYGITLLVKLGVLGIVALTGFYNWRFVQPRLGTPEATVQLRRSATVEVAVAVLVLLVTAVLVASPTSMDMDM